MRFHGSAVDPEGGVIMYIAIEQARQAALDLLKPSATDLGRGLELHRRSLVVDSYGFVPRSAVDGPRLARALEEGASESELQGLTEGMLLTRHVDDAREREEFLAAVAASGVTCVMQNAGEEGNAPLRLLKRLACLTYVTDHMPEHVSKALRPDDVRAAKAAGRSCVCLTNNGVPLAQEWANAHDELAYVRTFQQLGVRMMHLTYNRRNMLGDGCAEPADAGLSDLGRAAIATLNRVGIIVDVAHSGWRTSLEAAQASSLPIMASHTACAALHAHIRGKPDTVFKAIAAGGGLAGICGIPAFLGKTGDVRALLDHVDYLVGLIGVDHVAIGTDTAHMSSAQESECAKIPGRRRMRASFEGFWPANETLSLPEWNQPSQLRSLAWTNWPLFTVGLAQRGYSDDDIQRLIGGNVLRVWQAVLDGAKPR
jgi:membrane dipeptidase